MKENNILIIDDSKSITKTLKAIIEKELGYNCIVGYSKKEASDLLLENKGKFIAALLDLNLPDATDGEVVEFVSKFHIPIVVLTGSELKKDEERFRALNIVDYVIKDGMYSYYYTTNIVKRIMLNSSIKVLVVDDSKVFLESTKDLLEQYKLLPLIAQDGVEALELIEKNQDIKLVLTDYLMPNMDGLELTRNIRKNYSKEKMSIIVTSSYGDRTTPSKFLKYGANDFLHKDSSKEEFFVRISSNLESIELFEELNDKANKDYLTGLYNRRYIFQEGKKIYEKYKSDGGQFAAAIVDIDHFKNINDTYGHDIGDIALKEVSGIFKKFLPKDALLGRLGGEEFTLLIYNRSEDEVKEILDNIKQEFEKNIINTQKGDLSFTVSIGCSFDFGDNIDHMIQKADKYLYNAKEGGRNRVRYR